MKLHLFNFHLLNYVRKSLSETNSAMQEIIDFSFFTNLFFNTTLMLKIIYSGSIFPIIN